MTDLVELERIASVTVRKLNDRKKRFKFVTQIILSFGIEGLTYFFVFGAELCVHCKGIRRVFREPALPRDLGWDCGLPSRRSAIPRPLDTSYGQWLHSNAMDLDDAHLCVQSGVAAGSHIQSFHVSVASFCGF